MQVGESPQMQWQIIKVKIVLFLLIWDIWEVKYYFGQLEPLDEKVSGSNLSKNIFKTGVEYVCILYIYSNIHQLLKGFLIVPHMWHVADSDKFYDNFTQTCFSSHLPLMG